MTARLSCGWICKPPALFRRGWTSSRSQNHPPPRVSERKKQVLAVEQARLLLEAAEGRWLEVLVTMAVVTGMRRGELLGLKWQDIDFAKETLQVCRSVSYIAGHGFIEVDQLEKRLKADSTWHNQVTWLLSHRALARYLLPGM